MPELTEGTEPFEVVDEEYRMEIEPSTNVFLKSYSENNGIAVVRIDNLVIWFSRRIKRGIS